MPPAILSPDDRLRVARPADLPQVDALLARSYPASLKADYPPSVLVTALPLISTARPSLLASGSYFLIERGEDVIGAGGWTYGDPWGGVGNATVGHVRHVVVDHRLQGQGVGRRLMSHVLATAGAAGLRQLECYATFTAVPFYRAMGFLPLCEIEMALRPGIFFPAVHMRHQFK